MTAQSARVRPRAGDAHRAEALAVLRLELAGNAPATLSSQASLLARFLRWADREAGGKRRGWTRQELQAFFVAEAEAGTGRGTLGAVRTALRTYLRALDEPLPPRLYGAKLGAEEQAPAVLDGAQVARLIRSVREHAGRAGGADLAAGLLALSTTYGLRREELCRVRFGPGRIMVVTAKTEAPREHLLPELLAPWLAGYPVLEGEEWAVSVSEASAIFHRLRKAAGIAKLHRGGWHSIRRALDTALMLRDDLKEVEVEEFMAWRSAPGRMSRRYFRPQAETVDRKVLDPELHPFLRLWA